MTQSEEKNLNDPGLLGEIDLKELFKIVWDGKRIIIGITAVFAIGAVVYSLMLTNYYKSESILITADSQDLGSLSQYSGLASLTGVSLPSAGGDGIVEVMEIIKSREFVKHLLTFENILPSLMAPKSFDTLSQELYFDLNVFDPQEKSWTSGLKPSYIETHETYISNVLTISNDKMTGLVSITVEHISPVFAKDFLTLIINEANNLKREKAINTSDKSLDHLKVELSNTSLVPIKESINQLIKAQLETRMMAKANEDYSLVMIEPPFIPEKKSKPGRAIICIVATMFGGMLSMLLVLVRHYSLGKEIKGL